MCVPNCPGNLKIWIRHSSSGLPQSHTVFPSSTEPAGIPDQYGLSLFNEWESSTHLYSLATFNASQSLYSAIAVSPFQKPFFGGHSLSCIYSEIIAFPDGYA